MELNQIHINFIYAAVATFYGIRLLMLAKDEVRESFAGAFAVGSIIPFYLAVVYLFSTNAEVERGSERIILWGMVWLLTSIIVNLLPDKNSEDEVKNE